MSTLKKAMGKEYLTLVPTDKSKDKPKKNMKKYRVKSKV